METFLLPLPPFFWSGATESTGKFMLQDTGHTSITVEVVDNEKASTDKNCEGNTQHKTRV